MVGSNTWSGGLREVVAYGRLHGCPRKFGAAGRLRGETDATCEQPVSSIDSLALISTRSGTKLVEYSFAHFLTRLEKTSPSVQCVAKCRRSQMSIPEAGYPHMAVCLEDRKHAGRTVLYCMIGN